MFLFHERGEKAVVCFCLSEKERGWEFKTDECKKKKEMVVFVYLKERQRGGFRKDECKERKGKSE